MMSLNRGVILILVSSLIDHIQGQGAAPVPVSNLRVNTPTATTLPITWTTSGSIDRFEVTYSYTVNRCSAPQGAPHTDTISDGSMRSHTLRGLNEDSSYTITVRAINTVGSTLATITADTLTSAPGGIPESISFSNVQLTSVTVLWDELPCNDRNGVITGYTVDYNSTTPPNTVTVSGSSNTRLVVDGLLPRTSYIFSVRALGAARSRNAIRSTATPTDVGFFLNGILLSNNSIVLLSNIGEGSGALYCLTDRTQCCSTETGASRGVWRFPDSTSVDLYQSRSYSSLLLNRRSSAVGPTGIYTCLIPDARNVLRTLYIGVYSSAGGGSPASSLIYSCTLHTLTCISSGGPVNTVTWRRNGVDISPSFYQLGQSLIDATASVIYNLLTVTSGDVEDYIGSFSCTVSNSRGSARPQSLDINGIEVSGNEGFHVISSRVDIVCSSDLSVQSIRWLSNGREVASNSRQERLRLPIASVTSSLANVMYTCEVQVMLATGIEILQEIITFRVEGIFYPRLPANDSVIVTPTNATIQWMLSNPYDPSRPETFVVSYGITPAQLNTSTPGFMATSDQAYSISLSSLEPGTQYFYSIESRNEFATTFTDVRSFVTGNVTGNVTDEATTMSSEVTGTSTSSAAAAGIIAGVVVISVSVAAVIGAVIIVIATLIHLKKRNKTDRPTERHIYDDVADHTPHEYEDIKKRGDDVDQVYSEIKTPPTNTAKGKEGFAMSKCSAYGPPMAK